MSEILKKIDFVVCLEIKKIDILKLLLNHFLQLIYFMVSVVPCYKELSHVCIYHLVSPLVNVWHLPVPSCRWVRLIDSPQPHFLVSSQLVSPHRLVGRKMAGHVRSPQNRPTDLAMVPSVLLDSMSFVANTLVSQLKISKKKNKFKKSY